MPCLTTLAAFTHTDDCSAFSPPAAYHNVRIKAGTFSLCSLKLTVTLDQAARQQNGLDLKPPTMLLLHGPEAQSWFVLSRQLGCHSLLGEGGCKRLLTHYILILISSTAACTLLWILPAMTAHVQNIHCITPPYLK